jgi:hypothetical protein
LLIRFNHASALEAQPALWRFHVRSPTAELLGVVKAKTGLVL